METLIAYFIAFVLAIVGIFLFHLLKEKYQAAKDKKQGKKSKYQFKGINERNKITAEVEQVPKSKMDNVETEYQPVKIYVSALKKKAKKINDNEGPAKAYQLLENWINSGDLKINQIISVQKDLITYLKASGSFDKLSAIQHLDNLMNNLSVRQLWDNERNLFKAYDCIEPGAGIKKKIKAVENTVQQSDKITYQDLSIFPIVCNFLIDQKQGDKVFKFYRAINYHVFRQVENNRNKIYYDSGLYFILATASSTGFKKPKYEDYFHYSLLAFFSELILAYFNLNFYGINKYLKLQIQNKEIFESKIEEEALNKWGSKPYQVKNFYAAIEKHAFENLPEKFGIPPELLNEEVSTSDLRNNPKYNYLHFDRFETEKKIQNYRSTIDIDVNRLLRIIIPQ